MVRINNAVLLAGNRSYRRAQSRFSFPLPTSVAGVNFVGEREEYASRPREMEKETRVISGITVFVNGGNEGSGLPGRFEDSFVSTRSKRTETSGRESNGVSYPTGLSLCH